MFHKKQLLIVYLTESVLRIYNGDEQLKTVEIPEFSDNLFQSLITLFREEVSPVLGKKNVLIVVGGKLLFQKAIVLEDTVVGEEDKEAFYKDLPIAEEDLARNTITTEHKVYLLGTNKKYYEALLSVTENVVAVLPLSLFSDDTAVDELTREQREDILKNDSLYEVGDFLKDNPYVQSSDEASTEETLTPHEQIVVTESSFNLAGLFKLIGFSLVLAALFFAVFVYVDQQGTSTSNETVATTSPTPTPTPENTIAKDKLTVQVLNGTGTPGQAGDVESLLTKAGFANIEVGNASEQDNQTTKAVVSTQVSETVKEELQTQLESYFTDVEVTASTEEKPAFDIVITTGIASE